MQIQEGYFYFIKDNYYDKVKDTELMKNKENAINNIWQKNTKTNWKQKEAWGLVFPDIIKIKNIMIEEMNK